MKAILIAAIAHEMNRAYCASLGDTSQPAWDDAPEWQRKSAIMGVEMHLANPNATPEQSHESWLAQKVAEGWTYGEVKDPENKKHPCCVPYAELQQEQKAKDYIFRATVHQLKGIPDADDLRGSHSGQINTVKPASTVGIKYIGRRAEWRDSVYGTGLYFNAGQVRYVPHEVSRKLLKHADLFMRIEEDGLGTAESIELQPVDDTTELLAQAEIIEQEKHDEINQIQDVLDEVGRMDKDALIDFAHVKFQQKLPKTMGEVKLRERVTQLVHQYGVV